MKLLQKIREALHTFRVDRNEVNANILRTLVGEVQRDAKQREDDEFVMSVLVKQIKNNSEYLAIKNIDAATRKALTVENELLQSFMPPRMTYAQINEVIAKYNSDGHTTRDVGVFVKMLASYAKENGVLVDNAAAIAHFKAG